MEINWKGGGGRSRSEEHMNKIRCFIVKHDLVQVDEPAKTAQGRSCLLGASKGVEILCRLH